jgi:hypothetical protein
MNASRPALSCDTKITLRGEETSKSDKKKQITVIEEWLLFDKKLGN